METKKNPQADLHRKRSLFFTLGLIVACMFVISAFEWKTFTENEKIELKAEVDTETMLEIPITDPKPPTPPKVQPTEVIEVPDNQEDVFDNFEFPELDDPIETKPVVVKKPKKPIKEIEEPLVDEPFITSEVKAEPKGGYRAFYQFIADNLKYPAQARRMGVEGKVFIQFIIEKDGSLTDIKVIRGIGSGCDEEAIRVLQAAPKWSPGKQRGNPVRIRKSIPIKFRLN